MNSHMLAHFLACAQFSDSTFIHSGPSWLGMVSPAMGQSCPHHLTKPVFHSHGDYQRWWSHIETLFPSDSRLCQVDSQSWLYIIIICILQLCCDQFKDTFVNCFRCGGWREGSVGKGTCLQARWPVEITRPAKSKTIIFIIKEKLMKRETRNLSTAMSHGKRHRDSAHRGAHLLPWVPAK